MQIRLQEDCRRSRPGQESFIRVRRPPLTSDGLGTDRRTSYRGLHTGRRICTEKRPIRGPYRVLWPHHDDPHNESAHLRRFHSLFTDITGLRDLRRRDGGGRRRPHDADARPLLQAHAPDPARAHRDLQTPEHSPTPRHQRVRSLHVCRLVRLLSHPRDPRVRPRRALQDREDPGEERRPPLRGDPDRGVRRTRRRGRREGPRPRQGADARRRDHEQHRRRGCLFRPLHLGRGHGDASGPPGGSTASTKGVRQTPPGCRRRA